VRRHVLDTQDVVYVVRSHPSAAHRAQLVHKRSGTNNTHGIRRRRSRSCEVFPAKYTPSAAQPSLLLLLLLLLGHAW
jgi:hypothetical protein